MENEMLCVCREEESVQNEKLWSLLVVKLPSHLRPDSFYLPACPTT